ncbi:type II secretion system F family protein [Microbacterium sp. ET2]|uniref:type II secretion system F family protein n=1 Tax=Microbacterium albipurpureum TaxID=3050384 RepID=UPI00259D2D35|nr:type II secretion system F family protein [Microbacterium sp. ET2 (Ac-2212)]WJL96222.1 type II secretion system F family protein [Microbacterium sp. ET2 (Ac-2212)]
MSALLARLPGRTSPAPPTTPAADTVLKLAVLLQAGVTPDRAWEHLAETGDATARTIRDRRRGGAGLASAISGTGPQASPWREVGAAWEVATVVGAPLAPSLRGLAVALRDAQEGADEVRVALAEPAGTARLIGWLPLLGVALGLLLGFDTVGILTTHPLGIACLVVGGALILIARRWTASLARKARPPGGIAGLDGELLAIALSGGVSIERAMILVTTATGTPPAPATVGLLELSRRAGVPAVELLRAAAALARHQARVDGRLRAAKLATTLLLPLGVCTLPAFLLLGVGPMFLSVLSSSALSL